MAMIVISDKCNKYTVKIIFVWPANGMQTTQTLFTPTQPFVGDLLKIWTNNWQCVMKNKQITMC